MPIENPLKSSSWQKLSQGLDQKSWTPWESQKIGVFYSHWLLGNKHHGNPGNPRLPTHGYQELSTTIRYNHPLMLRALLPEPGCERLSVLERFTSHTWSVPDWLAHSPKEQSGALGRNTWEILALVQLMAKFIKILQSYSPPISWWITCSISGHTHLKQFKCGLNMILHRIVLQVSYAYTHKPRMNYGEKNPLWNVLESSSQVQKQLLHIGQPKSYRSSSKTTSHSHSRCSRPAFTCRRRSNQCSISQEAPGHVYRFTLDQWRGDPLKRTRDSFCMTNIYIIYCFSRTVLLLFLNMQQSSRAFTLNVRKARNGYDRLRRCI